MRRGSWLPPSSGLFFLDGIPTMQCAIPFLLQQGVRMAVYAYSARHMN